MAVDRAHSRKEVVKAPEDEGPQIVEPLPDEALDSRRELFNSIFRECSADVAKKASLAEREQRELLDAQSLTYGEVDLDTLHDILNTVKREHGPLYHNRGIFLDLGSGAGKACVAAGLLHPFQRVVGIEHLQCLNDFAVAAQEKYVAATLPDSGMKPEIELLKGDFIADMEEKLEPIVSEVVILLVVATCFSEEQMEAVAKLAEKMPGGSIVVSFTQMLPESVVNQEAGGWTLVHSELKQMMWGRSTCFIFKKVPVIKLDAEVTDQGVG